MLEILASLGINISKNSEKPRFGGILLESEKLPVSFCQFASNPLTLVPTNDLCRCDSRQHI